MSCSYSSLECSGNAPCIFLFCCARMYSSSRSGSTGKNERAIDWSTGHCVVIKNCQSLGCRCESQGSGCLRDRMPRRVLTFLEFDMIKLRVMVRELFGFRLAKTLDIVVVLGRDFRAKSVEFVGRDFVGFGGTKGCVWIRGLNMKYTCFDFADPCNHLEGCSVHEADRSSGRTLRRWRGRIRGYRLG